MSSTGRPVHTSLAIDLAAQGRQTRIACVDRLRLLEQSTSLRLLAELRVKIGQQKIRVDTFGIMPDGFAERHERLAHATRSGKGETQVIKCRPQVRLELGGLLEG